MLTSHDPARANIRTMHASFVIIFLLIFVIFGLGAYETLAAIVNPSASVLLPLVDSRARATQIASAPGAERLWVTVTAPTQVYSPGMDPLRTAQPGERYQVTTYENGWALAVRQGDPPERAVWIAIDDRVQAPGLGNPLKDGLISIALVATGVVVILILYYGLRRRILSRRSRAARRSRGAANGAPREIANGSGRLPTPS